MQPEAQAAWTQAIGSLAAVVVALGIYLSDFFRRRSERHVRSRGMALVVREDIRRIEQMCTEILHQWPTTKNEGPIVEISSQHNPSELVWDFFKVPKGFQVRADRLHELGDAALAAQEALKTAEDLAALFFKWYVVIQWDELPASGVAPLLHPAVVECKRAAGNALQRIEKLLGGKV